jgi:cobalamin biosynthesis protein CobD/CbiB
MLAQISIWLLVIFFIFILSSFLSSGGLNHAALTVYHDLKNNGISSARINLKALAGRDSEHLNESEISRAVVESVAENTGDGIGSLIFYTSAGFAAGRLLAAFSFYNSFCAKSAALFSSLFYYLTAAVYRIAGTDFTSVNLQKINFNGNSGSSCTMIFASMLIFGITGAVIYKTSNLMDSLVGYKNKKYIKFGKFSARLDDVLNYIPFRITAVFMIFSLIILNFFYKNKRLSKYDNSYDFKNAVKTWQKFRKMHPSPNAGQLESITAGALKVRLGGTNYYGGIVSSRAAIGFKHYNSANVEDIIKSLSIMRVTSVILIVSLCCIGLILL